MNSTFNLLLLSLMLVALSALSNPSAAKEKVTEAPFRYSVNLPQSYHESNLSYPVIFLIDSTPFYKGTYFTDTTSAIRRLERFNAFPETIVVKVEVSQLYRYATRDRNKLNDWLALELGPLIAAQYRTLERNAIVGFSYTAGGLMNSIALRDSPFTAIISLSPVFESVSDIPEAVPSVAQLPFHFVVFGNEHHRFMQFYRPLLATQNSTDFSVISLPHENHQSVLIPGLRRALLRTFADYQLPDYSAFVTHNYTPQALAELLKLRKRTYGVAPVPSALSDITLTAAITYSRLGKFELAEQHWRVTESQHKSYFINQIIDELERGQHTDFAQRARALRKKLDL